MALFTKNKRAFLLFVFPKEKNVKEPEDDALLAAALIEYNRTTAAQQHYTIKNPTHRTTHSLQCQQEFGTL